MTEENEWKDKLSKLNNDFSQILYLINYLYYINRINKNQKLILKNLLLLETKPLFILLKNLKETKNINEFSISLKKLITQTCINNAKIEDSYNKNKNSNNLIKKN